MNSETVDRDQVLKIKEGYVPTYDDLLEAVKANCFWCIAEDENLGTFHEKMNLLSYAEWASRKALGLPCDKEWVGVPRLVIKMAHNSVGRGE